MEGILAVLRSIFHPHQPREWQQHLAPLDQPIGQTTEGMSGRVNKLIESGRHSCSFRRQSDLACPRVIVERCHSTAQPSAGAVEEETALVACKRLRAAKKPIHD